MERLRVRLGFANGVAADDRIEHMANAELLDHREGETLELVGADGEARTTRPKRFHGLQRAGIEQGVIAQVPVIIVHQHGRQHIEPLIAIIARCLHRTRQHYPSTLADIALDLVHTVRRQADGRKRMIDRIGEVDTAVHQRSVEVEANNIESILCHQAAHALSMVAMASQTWQRG